MDTGNDLVTSKGRERIAMSMSYFERQTTSLALSTYKTSAVGHRSDGSGGMTQYSTDAMSAQSKLCMHDILDVLGQQSAVKIDSRSNWERIGSQS